ncbi:MAG: SDR family NAD(P)-dependent oxidoreductase [Clostridiales Family XIII bacterium]|jgi:3-oxoacyl-[acyl-carrier protein] reductase|nr:SDR family NAD(P)-dependent oxidoreductase [Clostridiales Family XIII bacterium]
MRQKSMTDAEIDSYGLEEIGWNRVPQDIVDKSVSDLVRLDGKKAIVTGAGGVGLGKATAGRLVAQGAEVVLMGHSSLEKTQKNADDIAKKWNGKTHAVVAELTDYADAERAFKEAVDKLGGRLDILVNNAVGMKSKAFDKMTAEEIQFTVNGTFASVAICCRVACDYMIPQGEGRIINISSEAARSHHPAMSLYSAAKAGVMGLTRTLSGELYGFGIVVNGVAAGVMLHEHLRHMFEHKDPNKRYVREAMIKSCSEVIANRPSLPDEVANMVAYLSSPAASYIVGQNIMHGGGLVVL